MSKKTKQPKPVKCGRVTHVAVSRLYNLGNYQNIKFDLSAEIPAGASAQETFRRLNLILQDLAPFKKFEGYEVKRLEDLRKKTRDELSQFEKDQIEELQSKESDFNTRRARRTAALQAIDDIGGAALFQDAKSEWSHDDDDCAF